MSLCFLLGHLFLLDGSLVFSGELQVGNGNVVQNQSELLGSLLKLLSDQLGDFFSVSDHLRCGVLGHHLL